MSAAEARHEVWVYGSMEAATLKSEDPGKPKWSGYGWICSCGATKGKAGGNRANADADAYAHMLVAHGNTAPPHLIGSVNEADSAAELHRTLHDLTKEIA